jgi:tetratricopeptide (TPR) repeat protein
MGARTPHAPRRRSSLSRRLLFGPALVVAIACAGTYARTYAQRAQPPVIEPAAVAQLAGRVRAAAPTDAATAEEALAAAYALLGAARWADALTLFDALVAQRPRDAAALYGAALANFNLRRVAEAEPLARAAVAAAVDRAMSLTVGTAPVLRQRLADALVLLAIIEAVKGDNAAALADAQRAVGVMPGHFDAQFTLGRALYGAGDPAAAAAAFRAALAVRPQDARAQFFLATALERAGDEAGALAAYRALVAAQPAAAEGHTGLGVLLVKRGGADTEEGLSELRRAVALDADAYEARVTLGRTLVQQGRAAEAAEHLQRAAALAPNNPEPHYQLALAYRRLGRAAEAAAESKLVRQIHEARRQATAHAPTNPD